MNFLEAEPPDDRGASQAGTARYRMEQGSGSLSDFGVAGCKPTAPAGLQPIFWARVRPFPGEMAND